MTIEFSRRLALLFGCLLPVVETIRRFHQLKDLSVWPFWLDDWLIGGLLLLGAWRTGKDPVRGQPFLAAGWGFTCAMAYTSFFFQLSNLSQPDPSGVSPAIVVGIKGAGLALAIAALVATLKWKQTP